MIADLAPPQIPILPAAPPFLAMHESRTAKNRDDCRPATSFSAVPDDDCLVKSIKNGPLTASNNVSTPYIKEKIWQGLAALALAIMPCLAFAFAPLARPLCLALQPAQSSHLAPTPACRRAICHGHPHPEPLSFKKEVSAEFLVPFGYGRNEETAPFHLWFRVKQLKLLIKTATETKKRQIAPLTCVRARAREYIWFLRFSVSGSVIERENKGLGRNDGRNAGRWTVSPADPELNIGVYYAN